MIFLGVEGTLLYSLVKYRARRGGPEAEQIHGNTPLEIGWTIGAAVILVVLTVVTFLYLPDIENPPASGPDGLRADNTAFASIDQPEPPKSGGPVLRIDVNGQQYLWRYEYRGGDQLYAYYEMVVPTDTTVVLQITSSDVQHSWWIPKLGGKADAVPGYVNETWFKIPAGREGTYFGQCASSAGPTTRTCGRRRSRRTSSRPGPRPSAATSQPRLRTWPHSARGEKRAEPNSGSRPSNTSPAGGAARGDAPRAAHPAQGWLAWLTTTDHKKIGILYIVTAFVFMLLGGVEALIMRLQLGEAENTLVSPETYNGLVTMHGTTMVFLFVIPLIAGFGNYLVPLMGARDMASQAERPVLLAHAVRRSGLLQLAVLRAAAGRLDVLRPSRTTFTRPAEG